MYQNLILFILLILAKNSSQSSDLLNYQIYSSNQEISYFMNYLDSLLHLLNQTLNDYKELPFDPSDNGLVRNSTCFRHLQYTVEMAKKEEAPWAMKLFDSIGKPQSGIMEAGFSFLGLYSECVDITNDLFDGQYCLATINLPATTNRLFQRYVSKQNNKWSDIQAKIGICSPSTCSMNEISSFTNKVISKLINGSTASFTNCYEKEALNEKSIGFYVSLIIILFFISLVILATVYDYYLITKESNRILQAQTCQKVSIDSYHDQYNENSYYSSTSNRIFSLTQAPSTDNKINLIKTKLEESLLSKVLLCFSAIKNSKKIFNTTTSEDDSISCLNGLKVICMLWIIVGHSYSFGITWLFFSNPNTFKQASQNMFSQLFANGTFSVDIFFFISGLLVCTSALKLMKKTDGKLNVFMFYIYRYLRIAPLMLIVIVFSANLLRYIQSGPNWLESITMYDVWCKDNWWLNVLHLHNFINREQMCLSHSWYSAVDLQFYFFSPIILIPLYKRPKLGLSILFAVLASSIAITAVLTAINDYPAIPYVNGDISLSKLNEYYGQIYIKPYCRIGPYAVGMLFGYLIYKGYAKIKIGKVMHVTLTFSSIITLCAIIFSMHDANNGIKPSIQMATFYSSCSRTLFAICLAYFVFCFINGKLKMLNALLSANILKPFSRVSYSAYLIHPIIMAAFYGSREQSFVFSNYLMFYFVIGHIFVTYIFSFITTIFFESPFINLSRLFLK